MAKASSRTFPPIVTIGKAPVRKPELRMITPEEFDEAERQQEQAKKDDQQQSSD